MTFSRRRYVSVFLAVCEWGRLASSSSSREPKSTANITADMFSVAVYYQTPVKDASTSVSLLVDAAAGRRAVTHCKEHTDVTFHKVV